MAATVRFDGAARRRPCGGSPSSSGRCTGPPEGRRVHLEMYAVIIRGTMPAREPDRYSDLVQWPATGRLTHFGSRVRQTNPWVLDALLATAFLALVLGGHFASGDGRVEYHDANAVSVLLTIGVAVPYYFRRHAPLAVLLVSELCVVL